MSGLPPIPPRPDRTKARSPAPATAFAPAGNGAGSTLGSDIPIVPPRPKRRIDRSQSPSKPLSPSIPAQEPAVAAPGIIIQTQDGSDLVALERTSTPPAAFPPTTLEPPATKQIQARMEQDQTHTPVPEVRTLPEDLELKAPKPTVPRRSNTEKSDKLEAITRTDSAQVADMDLEEPKEEVKKDREVEDKKVADQLEPETHEALMASIGQPEPVADMNPDRRFSQDEVVRKPIEVEDNGLVKVALENEEPTLPEPTQVQHDNVEEKMPKETEIREADDDAGTIDTSSASRASASGEVISDLEPSMKEIHNDGAHVSGSGIQLGSTPIRDPDVVKGTLPEPEEEKSTSQEEAPAPTTESSAKIKAVPEPLKLGSNVPEEFDVVEVEEDKIAESSMQTLVEENKTDKNEVDEIMGEPAEPASLDTLKKECAVEDSSATNSPLTPWGEPPKSSIGAISDVHGEHMEIQIPEQRPTTGAVAFHQELKAEGVPLSTEEGRATTGVAAVISKPAIPARPRKKLTDPKPLESRPVPVPAGLPQIDGPPAQPVQEPAHVLPSAASKPPVPLASKPAIPPRPGRPPRPVKKDSLNGSEGAPLTTVSSTSSARSLFEAGGPEAAAAAAAAAAKKAKPKPPVPARPIGSKIAALQGGFLSELNKKLKIGPIAPVKEEPPKEEEGVEPPASAPLVDQRKGRARGPQRRAPARAAAPVKETSSTSKPPAPPTLSLSLTAPMTVWEVAPEDGDIKLPSGATTPTKTEKAKGKEPEIVVKADSPTVTESKPDIDEPALPITKDETKELEQAKEDLRVISPSAVSEAEQDAQAAASSWTGTTALGAVAMSAQEVISQTTASASKTIKDFTEGEEHVLSDVENKDSPAASEIDSAPASPKLPVPAQNDGPNEVEAQARSLAAPESAVPTEAAVPAERSIPPAQPPQLEETQHSSEEDYPPPLQSSEAPTVLRSPDSAETEISIKTATKKVADPEVEPATLIDAEPVGMSASGVAAEEPEGEIVGDVPVPATERTPQLPDTTVEQLKELKKVESEEEKSAAA